MSTSSNNNLPEDGRKPAGLPAIDPRWGFTLIEVLIAMAICAVAMVVFSMTTQVNLHTARVMQVRNQAALLVRGVVLDLEAKIRKDGVPSNSVEGRPCDLPDAFKEKFRCEYDLFKFEIEEETLQEMLSAVTAKLMGVFGGQKDGKKPDAPPSTNINSIVGDGKDLMSSPLGQLMTSGDKMFGGLDMSKLTPLMPLITDTTGEFSRFCNFNIAKALVNFTLVITMFPILAEELSNRTRQLKVRITWGDKSSFRKQGKGQRLEVVTYLTFIGKELKLEEGEEETETPIK